MHKFSVSENIKFLMFFVVCFASQQSLGQSQIKFERDVACAGSLTSYDEIVKIVKSMRATNTKLPKQELLFSLEIKKRYCHFYYIEKGPAHNMTQAILLNGNGEIINWIAGHNSVISGYPCKEKLFSRTDYERFMLAARAKFSHIPPKDERAVVTTKKMNKSCLYSYTEKFKRVIGDDETWVRYFFRFDHNGELVSFSEMNEKTLWYAPGLSETVLSESCRFA